MAARSAGRALAAKVSGVTGRARSRYATNDRENGIPTMASLRGGPSRRDPQIANASERAPCVAVRLLRPPRG